MIPVKDDATICVLCPAYKATGGPELLHQLVYTLNKQNTKAVICYYGIDKTSSESPRNSQYDKYCNTYISFDDLHDESNQIIVFPEIFIDHLDKFKKSTKVVWWLSVDNYLKNYSIPYIIKKHLYRRLRHVWRLTYPAWRARKKIDYNLAQSWYAVDYLKKHRFNNIEYLSDYVNEQYVIPDEEISSNRSNIVLYNPRKGFEFTKKIIEYMPDVTWVPLQNLTRDEVRTLLEKAKVYIDFGNHPGKDRFPREAAISGCCVITNRQGSAGYDKDVPLAPQYKFNNKESEIPQIVETIKNCLIHYEDHIHDFAEYRSMIRTEKGVFEDDTNRIFVREHTADE